MPAKDSASFSLAGMLKFPIVFVRGSMKSLTISPSIRRALSNSFTLKSALGKQYFHADKVLE
jgi:hypothetical protein